ncbi:MAG: type I restriction endonuclease [Actinomycetota bacterium]|nr:type I restriction endonuclease [Actinomycetota bacterium]
MSDAIQHEVERLVAKFKADEAHYADQSGVYKESDTRSEFVDPLLRALGWDVENLAGITPALKDVRREESQEQEDASTKFPDYTLCIGGVRVLFLEAKKPSVDVTSHMESIRQARRYGYSGSHPIAILTNFRDLVVYDTTFPVQVGDLAATGRLYTWNYTDFPAQLDEIQAILARSAVAKPQWTAQFGGSSPQQPVPVGEEFIRHFNGWRLALGRDLYARHKSIAATDLNDAVQRILNRLIFVRMCEDRGIEGERTLRDAVSGGHTKVTSLLNRLHRRYNTGLFTSRPGDASLQVSEQVLQEIVSNLYSPQSPFSFAVLDAAFLGLVYEATLVEHLAIVPTAGKTRRSHVVLKAKREYEHREVVTTPQPLVDQTVREAMSALDATCTQPKTLDFAVGSGRFLLSVLDRLIEDETARQPPGSATLVKTGSNEYRLKFDEKCRLLSNLYGIDIDFNAVEVAKFSLLVRLLQDESKASLPPAGTRSILPNLDSNIWCGNTLVRALPGASQAQEELTNPLDLTTTAIPSSVDLVVGNPPYMKTEDMKKFDPVELNYLKQNYNSAFQQFDKSSAFIEFASRILKPRGVLGVVVPNKWLTVVAAMPLRSLLRSTLSLVRLDNFREVQVFPGKSIYICTIVAKKAGKGTFTYSEPRSVAEYLDDSGPTHRISAARLPTSSQGSWVLPTNAGQEKVLSAIHTNAIPLEEIVEERNGIQTSRGKIYVIQSPRIVGRYVEWTASDGKSWKVERAITRPFLDDSRNVHSYHEVVADSLILFPYELGGGAGSASAWAVIDPKVMRKRYPLAYKYFLANKAELDKRDMSADERSKAFYSFGRSQAIGYAHLAPKIFYTNNQRGDKYGIDVTGIVYASGGTGGEVALFQKDMEYSLDFVLGLLDQAPIEFFLRKRGSVFRGGYYSRGTDVIGDTPVPKLDFAKAADKKFHDDVTREVRVLRSLHMKTSSISTRHQLRHQAAITASGSAIRDLFLARWKLTVSDLDSLGL